MSGWRGEGSQRDRLRGGVAAVTPPSTDGRRDELCQAGHSERDSCSGVSTWLSPSRHNPAPGDRAKPMSGLIFS